MKYLSNAVKWIRYLINVSNETYNSSHRGADEVSARVVVKQRDARRCRSCVVVIARRGNGSNVYQLFRFISYCEFHRGFYVKMFFCEVLIELIN